MSAVVKIGPHRLILGDAYAVRPQLGFFDADVLDPPYQIRASGGGHYRKKRPAFDQLMAEALHKGFDLSIINPLQCGAAVVFSNGDALPGLLHHLQGTFSRHALCIWQKVNPQPIANKHYRSDCEFWVHGWSRGFHPDGSVGEKLRVRRFASVREPEKSKVYGGHPTPKPAALMDSIMANVSGRTVCDPFMGSGSTGVAAIRAGKTFTGIEHNPAHFETAVRRISEAWAASQQEAA